MKKVLTILMVVALTTAAQAATIAHWTFNDAALGAADGVAMPDSDEQTVWREAATDHSGNGNHLTTWEYASAGFDWTSDSFKGDFGMVATGDNPASMTWSEQSNPVGVDIETITPAQWTVEAIFKCDDPTTYRTIVGRDGMEVVTGDDAIAPFYLSERAGGVIGAQFADNAGINHPAFSASGTIVHGTWYHVAGVSDGMTLTVYLKDLDADTDYVEVATADLSGSADSSLAVGNSDGTDWNPGAWTVARGLWNGWHVDRFYGVVDEVAISNTALSPGSFICLNNTVTIIETDGQTMLPAGDTNSTDSYGVVLGYQPTDDVNVTVIPPAGLSVGNGDGQSRVLTFTSQNWDQAQTVTVSIADAGAILDDIEIIQHTAQSDDQSYNNITIRDVQVYIVEDICGSWGYLESDYNLDCNVNFIDFSILANLWLDTDPPIGLQPFVQDWLLNTLTYDETIFSRSIQQADQPFFVDTSIVENTIDEKIYGHFLEHIYHSVNGGLWGEQVWNRSFEMSSGGIWSIEGDELVQSSLDTDIHMEFGDTAWTDYELTLQAKKDGGSEGFLILFRAPDSDNFYWLNLGGWGNIQHAIEKEVNGGRSVVTSFVPGSINTVDWYDIRIRCEGNNIQVWLDEANDSNPDPLIFNYTDTGSPHLTGNVGVGTWATQARFRDIEVTDLAGTTTLYSGLPSLPGGSFGVDFWTVFGAGDIGDISVSTDALNNDYSVKVVGDGSAMGLQQNNFKFIQQAYHGSLWMKGTLPAGVSVALMDGETILGQATLSAPTSSWSEYPFSITPSAGTDNGSLRITLLGAGTVYIDQVSMMGQDAIDTGGFRPDLLQAIQELNPPVIRWPGGYFAELYRWKSGIGPQSARIKYPIIAWDDLETNAFGTDEFMKLCQTVNCEPIVVINIGSHDAPGNEAEYVLEAQQWLEYCNGDANTTTWGAERAANGHPAPYNVKYWEIDNEVWFQMDALTYCDKLNTFIPALKAVDPTIKIIACGSGGYDQDWNRTVIDECGDIIDYISVHHYEFGPDNFKAGPRSYETYIEELGAYITSSSYPSIKIYMSEWNLQTTDWRTGLYAGGLLNAFERNGDVFTMAGPALFLRHTSAAGWDNAFINFDHTGWFPAPNYVVMKLWHNNYAPNLVNTTGTDTDLNVASTLSDDAKTLYIQIVNPDASDKSVEFEIDSSFVAQTAYMYYVAPGDLYARNTLADPQTVHVQAKVIGLDNQVLRFFMPGYSAGVVTVQAASGD